MHHQHARHTGMPCKAAIHIEVAFGRRKGSHARIPVLSQVDGGGGEGRSSLKKSQDGPWTTISSISKCMDAHIRGPCI